MRTSLVMFPTNYRHFGAHRYSVPTPTLISFAIRFHPSPCARRAEIRAASTTVRGRPSRLPLARALRKPARTRSAMRLRSNSATAPKTVKTMRPAGVAVSRDSDRLTNSIPRTRKVSSARKRWLTLRAKRSNFHTATISNRRLWASAMSLSSSGRRSFAPEIPVSTYSPARVQPRRSQYSRNSRSCISGDWPLFDVLILAYRAVRVMLWAATLHLHVQLGQGRVGADYTGASRSSLPLRLAASAFAVVLLLVLVDMLQVAVGPDAAFDVSDPHPVRF